MLSRPRRQYRQARVYVPSPMQVARIAFGQVGASSGTMPTDPAVCSQQGIAMLKAIPGTWEEILKEAGSEAAAVAMIDSACESLVRDCGGMTADQCCEKIAGAGATTEQCNEALKQRFLSGGKEESKSSFPWWLVGVGVIGVAGVAALIGGGVIGGGVGYGMGRKEARRAA